MFQSGSRRCDDGAIPRTPRLQNTRFRRGSFGAASAIGVVAIVGTLGLSSGRLSSQAHATRTQIAVQQGALAGAAALQDGGDAVGAATALLGQIGLTRADGALRARVEINRPPLTGPHAGDANAVEVVLLRPSPIGLAHVALATAMPTRIRAVAMLSAMAPACEPAALLTNCVASEANPWLPSPRLVE